MLLLRSLLFNLGLWVSVSLFAPLAMLTFPLPAHARYRFISQWARFAIWWLGITCRLHFTVEGREHLPTGSAIVLAKHQSAWETLAFQMIFPPQVWVLKRELLWVPLFGWGLAMLEPIAIDRRAGRKAVEQIVDQGRQRLDTGHWVVVFPEGTRIAPRQMGRFGIGGSALASRTGYPVVPVAHNAGHYWRRRGFIKRPGVIRVVIGPTIDSQGRSADEINVLARTWMSEMMQELERPSVVPADDLRQSREVGHA